MSLLYTSNGNSSGLIFAVWLTSSLLVWRFPPKNSLNSVIDKIGGCRIGWIKGFLIQMQSEDSEKFESCGAWRRHEKGKLHCSTCPVSPRIFQGVSICLNINGLAFEHEFNQNDYLTIPKHCYHLLFGLNRPCFKHSGGWWSRA